ncbi:MAG TPA: dTDP-4-dehydrorhamnose 3,5-epimerase [Stellaceae bacterium]|nr:dTDP-4-dehydrorhamnose 3,5-epimerase [Stellaceae bacterium]
MQIIPAAIDGVLLIVPDRHPDARGFFSETYREAWLGARGVDCRLVQDNHSLSRDAGVVRGLHFQIPPAAQAKLVRVTAGAIFDVAVDLRRNSPSFGRHVATRLSAAEWNQIFIPEGFAHGFCVLEPDTQVLYKTSDYYSAAHERGLLWNDPTLAIQWPVGDAEAILSDKDRRHPSFAELPAFFE